MGVYVYNEEKFLLEMEDARMSFDFPEMVWDYLAEAAKCHYYYWDDERRSIADEVRHKHDRAHRILINYSKNAIPEKWKELIEYLDTFLYEGTLICDIFDNANEEQKGAYFGEDYHV